MINKIDRSNWRLLFQTYLYEEFLMNAIAGRNFNFNKNDDSCIYNAKSKSEIDNRLSTAFRKVDTEKIAVAKTIAYKIPTIVPYLKRFLEIVPNSRVVLMERNPVDTINSLLRKNWFSNESLNKENRTWPFVKYKNNCIPHWVPKNDYDYWVSLSELDRCAYYYVKMRFPLDNEQIHTINYDDFLISPSSHLKRLCENFGLEFGGLTNNLLSSIKRSRVERDNDILSKVSPNLRDALKSSLK
jgi:hypothetical protein